jgi:drug/metabolite transporter (DMT)-like permease
LSTATVIAVSEGLALAGLVVIAGVEGRYGDDPAYVGWALAAGLVGLVALSAFYLALAQGTMGVVAPIAALGVVVPVVVGVAEGDRPSAWQAVGLAAAIAGVVLAGGPELRRGDPRAARSLLLAGAAAVGFGAVIVCIARGARDDTLMTLLVMRLETVVVLVALALTGRVRLAARRGDLPMLAAIGAGDVGANAMFAVASTRGLLSVVSVLSSLYPAVTVLLARLVHGERPKPIQDVGVLLALAGVALIASGGGVSG